MTPSKNTRPQPWAGLLKQTEHSVYNLLVYHEQFDEQFDGELKTSKSVVSVNHEAIDLVILALLHLA